MNFNIRKRPTVFVSSTCYDLKQVREDIKDFFENTYGFEAILSEFNSFPIDPAIGTCDNCLNNVDNYADFFILIIGNRYGYITEQGKSITNLEYLHAKAKGIPIFVFVDKQLYATWNVWKGNKDGDYSSLVDNPKMFEFISDIYDGSQQWVYTYDSVKDITMTMKHQLALIFSDGLIYKQTVSKPQYSVLNGNLSADAIRMVVEQPFAWEYKFFAYELKKEFEKLKTTRWNFNYGLFDVRTASYEPMELLGEIGNKLNEIMKLTDFFNTLVNTTLKDALGEPGKPSDLEMLVYTTKKLASVYERILYWGLHFKALQADPIFDKLLTLMYELPTSFANQLDDFVSGIYTSITTLPTTDPGTDITINLECKLDVANTPEVIAEMTRLTSIAPAYFIEKSLSNQ